VGLRLQVVCQGLRQVSRDGISFNPIPQDSQVHTRPLLHRGGNSDCVPVVKVELVGLPGSSLVVRRANVDELLLGEAILCPEASDPPDGDPAFTGSEVEV